MLSRVPFPNCRNSVIGLALAGNPENDGHLSPWQERVGAANSGWYALPALDPQYPDGFGGIGLTPDDTVRLLDYPLMISSGDPDIEGMAESFPRHDAAVAQGPNRFARAQFCIVCGRAEAAKLGGPCRRGRVVVPGAAHERMRTSAFADYWFGGAGGHSAPRGCLHRAARG